LPGETRRRSHENSSLNMPMNIGAAYGKVNCFKADAILTNHRAKERSDRARLG
jgi:hypothetical protein